MKKVVVIAYAFPPVGGGGVQRPTKFVKYLREFGWEPIVLTVANPSVPLLDESLMKDIPPGVRIYRARTMEPSYSAKKQYAAAGDGVRARITGWMKRVLANVLLPDVQVLWWPGLVVKLLEVLRSERPDCLFVTAPPFSSFIPVVALGRLFRVPVVVDFRDEWSFSRQQWEHAAKTPLAFWLDRIFERYVVGHCSGLVAANASYIESLGTAHLGFDRSKAAVITNGYDEDDFIEIRRVNRAGDKVHMVYAGTVWNGNSLEPFVQALKMLASVQPELASRLNVRIYGRVVESQLGYLQDPALEGVVTLCGYQDHTLVLTEMFNADVLLLAMTELPGAEKIILGKVFEYLATGKHILAIVPDGETKTLITENTENASVLHPSDISRIRMALHESIINIETIRNIQHGRIENFSRKSLTQKLSTVLNRIISGN